MKTENEVKTILMTMFNIDSEVQVLDREKERVLYLIESISVSSDLTIGTVLELCDKIANAIGGELYGTVNLDFTVRDKITFEMMVEEFRN